MSTKLANEKTRLFLALKEIHPKVRAIFEEAEAKYKIDGVALLVGECGDYSIFS